MLALDLFNTKYERDLAEGAVDDLEARRIDTLNDRMQDLLARAKEPAYQANPAALAALKKQFQQVKDERDSYYKVREDSHMYKGPHGRQDVERKDGVTRVTRRDYDDSTRDTQGSKYFPNKDLKGQGTGSAIKSGSGISSGQGSMRKRPRLDHDANDAPNYGVDEGGIPGNIPTEKIPGKEDLLKGKGRSYYESQKKNSESALNQRLDRLKVQARREFPQVDSDQEALLLKLLDKEAHDDQLNRQTDARQDAELHKNFALDREQEDEIEDLQTQAGVKEHGGGIGPRQHWQDLMPEQMNPEDYDDYEDEDLRLRSGDYVRDTQDGESGEIFRMQGDPYERRVRILDRDGKGWYIEPSRLTRVDPQDPDVQRYFGKNRQRDMDEAVDEKGALKSAQAAAKFIIRNLDDRAALKDYSMHFWSPEKFYQGATMAMRGAGYDEIVRQITQDRPAQFESGIAEESRGSATRQGQQDYARGLSRQQNPYYKSQQGQTPPEAYDWEAGWEHARDAGKEPGMAEGWSDAMLSRRTGGPRTPYAVYIKGRKWKDFENDDLARAVMNRLKAKFRADGRDPETITIAPTDIPEGVAEAKKKGLYYYVNKRKKAGTSRDANSPKAPTAQAWKDAAKTAKKEDVAEEKTRLDPKCWTGKKIGNPKTKVKGGVRVNNCVPAESINEDQDTSGVERAILNRIMVAHTDLLMKFGPDKVMQAAEEVAYNVGDVDEIGTSDVSAYVQQVMQILGATP
jgi:hypothetical protein